MPSLRVLVLGGTGFIGRHAALALLQRGHYVMLGTRCAKRAARKLPESLRGCELRETHFESLTSRYGWKPLLAGADVVVNAAGILRERGGETYDRVHNMAPAALAGACECLGLRLVHVAALGLGESRSRFARFKRAGERGIAATGADYRIVRAPLLAGEGGATADWLARIARWPLHPCLTDALGRFAPLQVRDLAEALAVLCEIADGALPREIELGGRARRTLAEHLDALRAMHDGGPALRVPIPGSLARIAGALCDLLHVTPVSLGLLDLVRRDSLPRENLLQALIGRPPAPVGRERPAPRPGYAFAAIPTGHDTPVPPSPQ